MKLVGVEAPLRPVAAVLRPVAAVLRPVAAVLRPVAVVAVNQETTRKVSMIPCFSTTQ